MSGLGQNDDKFFASQPREQIDRTQTGFANRRKILQNGIAGLMPVRVVDRLEMIDVHRNEAGAAIESFRPLHFFFHFQVKAAPGLCAREAIGCGNLTELELVDDEPRQILHKIDLRFRQFARFCIDRAKRADIVSVGRFQRDAGIKADVGWAEDKRVIAEQLVFERIGYDIRLIGLDGVCKKKYFSAFPSRPVLGAI